MPTEPSSEADRIVTPADLNGLLGARLMGDTPEVYWEDSHGCFQFHSEEEALQALHDPYYQQFLPDVDWQKTSVREVRMYPPYCADGMVLWKMVDRVSGKYGPLLVWREQARWHAAFGSHADAEARTPGVAICLAALRASGIAVQVSHDRLDAILERSSGRPPAH